MRTLALTLIDKLRAALFPRHAFRDVLIRGQAKWEQHWTDQGQPWRRDPEIGKTRQAQLQNAMRHPPNPLTGQYPFKGWRLSRADVEWLLATHNHGPVNWDNPLDRHRWGLDLRGAILSNVDLSGLPLARLRGGLSGDEWRSVRQHNEALLPEASINLEGAKLTGTSLQGSSLTYANMSGAQLNEAHLEGVDAFKAILAGPTPANLHGAFLDEATKLYGSKLANTAGVGPRLFNVRWDSASLTGIDWFDVRIVFDEYRAKNYKHYSNTTDRTQRRRDRNTWYLEAAITYRQLATALRAQGLDEEANSFSFKAERVHTKWLRHSGHLSKYLFWLAIGTISGWGYRLWRSAAVYVSVIAIFACTYWLVARAHTLELSFDDAIVASAVGFHGRGFMADQSLPNETWLDRVAAIEACVGLFVEAIIIATLTKRLFGR